MRKLLITALLGGCMVVPANSAIIVELTGTFTGQGQDYEDYPFPPPDMFSGSVIFSGECNGPCSLGYSDKEITVQGYYTNYFAVLHFKYDNPVHGYYSDTPLNGTGDGYLIEGYFYQSHYEFTFTSARIYQNDDEDYSSGWFPSMQFTSYHVDGVPEPTTWALMIGGFALAGAAMRRRKLAVTFA